MATNPITLLNGTTAYATDVETKVNPLYSDLDPSNVDPTSLTGTGTVFVLSVSPAITGTPTITSTTTTGTALSVTGSSLTTGKLGYFYSNSADTGTRNLIEIVNDNAAATGACLLKLQQDSDDRSISLAHDSTTEAIGGTMAGAFANVVTTATTQVGLTIEASSLSTGGVANFYSNSSNASARNIVTITNDHASAAGAVALKIQQDSAAQALQITGASTTGGVIEAYGDSLTTGNIALFQSNSADASARKLLYSYNDNAAATGAIPIYARQDAVGDALAIDTAGTIVARFKEDGALLLPAIDPPTANEMNRKSGIHARADVSSAGALNDSYNVLSVSSGGTGDYTILWDTDFSTATYSASVSPDSLITASLARLALIVDRNTNNMNYMTAEIQDNDTNQVVLANCQVLILASGDQ